MMSLIQILVACLLAFSATALPGNSTESQRSTSNPSSSTPRLVRLFEARTNIGEFLPPIPIAGGSRLVAKVTDGEIKGKAFSGTIVGGITVIDILNGGLTVVNAVRSIGSTTDGTPFLIEEDGIGSPDDNFARLRLSIGGRFANLANQFLFTEATLASDRRSVTTTAYQLLDR